MCESTLHLCEWDKWCISCGMLYDSGNLLNVPSCNTASCSGAPRGRRHGPVGVSSEEAMKVLRGLGSASRDALGGPKSTFQCLKGPTREVERDF